MKFFLKNGEINISWCRQVGGMETERFNCIPLENIITTKKTIFLFILLANA